MGECLEAREDPLLHARRSCSCFRLSNFNPSCCSEAFHSGVCWILCVPLDVERVYLATLCWKKMRTQKCYDWNT